MNLRIHHANEHVIGNVKNDEALRLLDPAVQRGFDFYHHAWAKLAGC